MEPQETIYCFNNKETKCHEKKNCLGIVGVILLALFTLVIGLLIGAALSTVILAALPAIIVFSNYTWFTIVINSNTNAL